MVDEGVEQLDLELEKLRKEKPDITFAQFYAAQVLKQIGEGRPHATLGPKLRKHQDWWKSGTKQFNLYKTEFALQPARRVIDYGCGTMRMGAHFVKFLDPGHYFGFEVEPEFLKMGQQLVGDEVLAEKRPDFAVIGQEGSRDRGVAFGADFVYSNAVAFHVHPDELSTYLGNLAAFAHKPGAVVAFDAFVGNDFLRYAHRGWIRTLDTYKDGMKGLSLVRVVSKKRKTSGDHRLVSMLLEFRREA